MKRIGTVDLRAFKRERLAEGSDVIEAGVEVHIGVATASGGGHSLALFFFALPPPPNTHSVFSFTA